MHIILSMALGLGLNIRTLSSSMAQPWRDGRIAALQLYTVSGSSAIKNSTWRVKTDLWSSRASMQSLLDVGHKWNGNMKELHGEWIDQSQLLHYISTV